MRETSSYNFNFRKGDYDAINSELLGVDWGSLLGGVDVNVSVDVLYKMLEKVISKYVPKTKINRKFPYFFTQETIRIIRKKHNVHNKYKIYKNPYHYYRFKKLRKLSKKLISRDFYSYLTNIEQDLPGNSKSFFKYVSRKKGHSRFPSIMWSGDVEARSPRAISECFADFFGSVFEPPSGPVYDSQYEENIYSSVYLSVVSLSEEVVEEGLKSLDPSKGPGPDNIPPIFLKNCSKSLTKPLSIIFNRSLQSGDFPQRWKLSGVVPVHKDGRRDLVQNYRPISILSSIPKLFESLVYKPIMHHVKHLIIENQHGFVKGRNLETNLVHFLEILHDGIEAHNQTDVIYTDFKKAFDKVNHTILFRRLAEVGICGSLLRWVRSYVLRRSQYVCVGGQKSGSFISTSGVPQGSHLGPLLFIIYINNISSCFRSAGFLVYADDLKIFLRIRCIEDVALLQEDLDRFCQYCRDNFLFLSLNKCQVISFTRNTNVLLYTYSMNQINLPRVNSVRDLGVILDTKLNFIQHIDNIISSSNKLLGFTLRHGKLFRTNKSLLIIYNSFVLSKLNFASPSWNPHYECHIKRLESVQHKFLKHLSYRNNFVITDHDYTEAQSRFNILSLENRRKMNDMSFLYKVLNGIFLAPSILQFISLKVPERRLRSRETFAISFRRLNVTRNSPVCRFLTTFNNEFGDTDPFFTSLSQFKGVLRRKLSSGVI